LHTVSSLYIHFPFCRHLCNYCDFYKSLKENEGQVNEFNEFLNESFQVHESLFTEYGYRWAPLETLYIGGGTPSLWGLSGAHLIKDWIKTKLEGFSENYEFTLEVNPGGWKTEEIESWIAAGVNRISFGVQSYNNKFLEHLDRIHRIKETDQTIKYIKSLNINYSVDFMLGLPYSERDKRNIIQELDEILKWDPPHLSLYILTTKEKYIHQKALPQDEWIEREYLEVSEYLTSKGYNHYEVSNFSKPGYESRHNLKYWSAESVAGIGPSASGFLFEKSIRYKWKNKQRIYDVENLNPKQLRLEKLYLKLRTDKGINGREFFQGKELESFLTLKKSWDNKGLLKTSQASTAQPDKDYNDAEVVLNSKGMLQMDFFIDEVFRFAQDL
jgi:oxygen-independent coproporphyrinogen III oxidase